MHPIWQENQKKYVTVCLVGDHLFKGVIFDSGSDIIVLFTGENFFYIPFSHIEYIVADTPDTEFSEPSNYPSIFTNRNQKDLTLASILKQAIGVYQEICIISKKSLYGTVLDVLEDYIVFYSPIYKELYIPIEHIKWLVPSMLNERPYSLSEEEFNWQQVEQDFKGNFIMQLATLVNKLVVINFGEKIHHIGKVKSITNRVLELTIAKDKSMYINLEHVQIIHHV